MTTQDNFPDEVLDVPNFRPRRISEQDRILIEDQLVSERDVVFGQTNRDVVEVYIVDELGDNVAHINLRSTDPALRLIAFTSDSTVGEGQDNVPDVLQIDLVDVLGRMGPPDPVTNEPEGLPPGRYSVAVNVFRNEVGQETEEVSRKLFISEISPSRTELRLRPVLANNAIVNELNEFVESSVPKFVAQAIVDQTFGVTLGSLNSELRSVTFRSFEDEIARLDIEADRTGELTTANRLNRADLESEFYILFESSIPLMRDNILNKLAANVNNLQIQNHELQQFIREGIMQTMIDLVNNGAVDPKIQLIDRNGNPITPTSTHTE